MKPPGSTRFFSPPEREALIAAINAVCAERRWMRTYHFVPTPTWKRVLRHGSDETHLLLVATDGDAVIGWCRIFPVDGGRGGEVGIGLLAPYRNQGLGTAMLQQAIEWAKARGFAYLGLSTRRDNRRAIHVFKRCGFRTTSLPNTEWMHMILPL